MAQFRFGPRPQTAGHTQLPNSILYDTDLNPQARLLYAMLHDICTFTREQPNQREIAGKLGCTEKSLRGYLGALADKGLLRITKIGRGKPNEYLIYHPDAPYRGDETDVHTDNEEAVKNGKNYRTENGKNDRSGTVVVTEPTRARSSSELQDEEQDSLVPTVLAPGGRPPKLVMVDGRNLPFDALSEVCGVDPHGNRAGEVAVALNGGKAVKVGIRELVWRDVSAYAADRGGLPPGGEDFERLVANEIRNRALLWEQKFGRDVTMGPVALAKWWTDLPGLIDRARSKRDERADTMAWLDEIIEGGGS